MRLFWRPLSSLYSHRKDLLKKKEGWKNQQRPIEDEQQKYTQSCCKNSPLGWWLWALHSNGHLCDLVLTLDTAVAPSISYECIIVDSVFGSKVQESTSQAAAAAAKSFQSCLTLCDPIDGSPPGSTIPGILQANSQADASNCQTLVPKSIP